MSTLTRRVQVNIPFRMLCESYLSSFLEYEINPEIGFDSIALDRYGDSDFSRIAKRLHERGLTITIHAPFMDLSPGSPDPGVRSLTRHRFEQTLRAVRTFKPKSVVCHAGYDPRRYVYIKDAWLEESLGIWSWLSKRLREEGARLMLENVYEHGPKEILTLLEKLGPLGVGFCLDTGHHAAFGNGSMKEWIEDLGPYLGQLHLHDNDGSEDSHLALGQGNVDFPGLFKILKARLTVPPIVTLEPHREEDLQPSIRYLEALWPW